MLIRREALAAALVACTDDDSRYFLNSIAIDPDGRVLATDGHILLIAKDDAVLPDEDFPFVGPEVDGIRTSLFHGNAAGQVLIPAELAKRLIAGTPKKSSIPVLSCVQIGQNGSATTVTAASTDLTVPTIVTINQAETAGKFPNVDRVVPKVGPERPTVRVILSVEVLENLIKATKAANGKTKDLQTIAFDVPIGRNDRETDKQTGKPGVVDTAIAFDASAAGDVHLSGVIMPCRR